MSDYAYIRVSTKDQKTDRQLDSMRRLNIPVKNIYADKQSGKDFDRPRYRSLMKKIRPGDVIYVKSIDRLGRNYSEILRQWAFITREKKADIVVLDMPLLDTRQKDGDLMGVFISDLVLQILSYVAQTERDFIKKRQAEGIAAAKERGVKFGAKAIEMPPEFEQVKRKWEKGEISLTAGGRLLGMVTDRDIVMRCVAADRDASQTPVRESRHPWESPGRRCRCQPAAACRQSRPHRPQERAARDR